MPRLQLPSLARSQSANSVKVTHVRDGPGGQWSVSSPELRSMLVNLSTTVPYNISSPHLAITPSKKQLQHRHKRLAFASSCHHCCRMEKCFGARLCLVVFQIMLGASITGLSVYIHLCVKAIKERDRPFWAGIPLLLSGLFGIFFCIKHHKEAVSSSFVFTLKILCTVFSILAIFTCVISTTFTCIHLIRLFTYAFCQNLPGDACRCYASTAEDAKTYLYTSVFDCQMVFCKVKICFLFSGGLCLLGSLVALSFLIVLWKSRYGHINARSATDHRKEVTMS